LGATRAESRRDRHDAERHADVTSRERKIAGLAAAGQSNEHIAAQLYLSLRIIGTHLYRSLPNWAGPAAPHLGRR
jgi:DNA-binding NarL/FixJ family response regulator